jgi:hypothetical protein
MFGERGFAVPPVGSEGLARVVECLVGNLDNLKVTPGKLAGCPARKLRVQNALVALGPGCETMAYARKE